MYVFFFFKFVETLDEWLQSLERHPQGPSKEVLVEYKAKVDFLKKVLESRALSQNESRNPKKTQNGDSVDIAGGSRRRSLRSLSPPNVSQFYLMISSSMASDEGLKTGNES